MKYTYSISVLIKYNFPLKRSIHIVIPTQSSITSNTIHNYWKFRTIIAREKTIYYFIIVFIITYKDNSSAFADLKVGALDAVVIDSVAADYYIAQTGEPFAIIPTPLADEKYVVGFKKGETELKNEVERILKEMEKDGTVAEISKKWFGKDLSIIR